MQVNAYFRHRGKNISIRLHFLMNPFSPRANSERIHKTLNAGLLSAVFADSSKWGKIELHI